MIEGTRIAIKVVDCTKLKASARDNLILEIGLLQKLKHKHIVQMKDFGYVGVVVFIAMEFCNGGDLDRVLKTYGSPGLPENLTAHFLGQLVDALLYLEKKSIVHLDLKPANILLTRHRARGGVLG